MKMQKMFTTQLTGLFKRIIDKAEYPIEDGARLLAQAPAGQGTIYIKGFQEMEGIVYEALEGQEPLNRAKKLDSTEPLTMADRVLLLTRFSDDHEAIRLGEELVEKGIPFVAISGEKKEAEQSIVTLADVHLNTQLVKPLLPGDDGNRVGFPSLIAASYLFHLLKFTIDDMLEEYN